MAEFGLVTEIESGDPVAVIIADEGKFSAYGMFSNYDAKMWESEKRQDVYDAISGGLDRYNTETGEYTGDAQKRIDEIVVQLKEKYPLDLRELDDDELDKVLGMSPEERQEYAAKRANG